MCHTDQSAAQGSQQVGVLEGGEKKKTKQCLDSPKDEKV